MKNTSTIVTRPDEAPYIGANELAIKSAYDQLRLQLLSGSVLDPIKEHGWRGLDESIYVATHILTKKQKKRSIRKEIRLNNTIQEQLESRGETPDEKYAKVAGREPDYRSLAVLGSMLYERKAARFADMKDAEDWQIMQGQDPQVTLSAGQRVILARRKFSDTLDSIAEGTGAVGNHFRRNALNYTASALLAWTGFSGYQWAGASRVHAEKATDYASSISYGEQAIAIKRDFKEQGGWAKLNLTYVPEMNIPCGEDCVIVTPPKPSMPSMARDNIAQMREISGENLSSWSLGADTVLSNEEKITLQQLSQQADRPLRIASERLRHAFDTEVTYAREIGLVIDAENISERAVQIFESHMDQEIVDAENSAHSSKQSWKWSTIIGGILGGGLFGNALRRRRNNSWKRSYY